MSDVLASQADRIVTIADWRDLSSEELKQSTLVHVIKITLEMVSAKVRKTNTLRRILHTARRPDRTSLLACSCSLEMDAVCRCGRARLTHGCHLREPTPCLARQASLSKRP